MILNKIAYPHQARLKWSLLILLLKLTVPSLSAMLRRTAPFASATIAAASHIARNPNPATQAVFESQGIHYTDKLLRGVFFRREEAAKQGQQVTLKDFTPDELERIINHYMQQPEFQNLSEEYRDYIDKPELMPAMEVRFVSRKWGHGTYALEDIKKGTFVAEYTGALHSMSSIRPSGGQWYDPRYNLNYPAEYNHVDAHCCGNESRYMNDGGKESNLSMICILGNDGIFHLVLIANRDIKAGEQLLWSYGFSYWTTPYKNYGKMCLSMFIFFYLMEDTSNKTERHKS